MIVEYLHQRADLSRKYIGGYYLEKNWWYEAPNDPLQGFAGFEVFVRFKVGFLPQPWYQKSSPFKASTTKELVFFYIRFIESSDGLCKIFLFQQAFLNNSFLFFQHYNQVSILLFQVYIW